MFVLSAELCRSPEKLLSTLRISHAVPCGAGAIQQNPSKNGTTGFSFQLRRLPRCHRGSAPVSFRLRLASRRDTGGRILDHMPSCLVRSRRSPVERRWWLASVGIGLGLLRSSISRRRAEYYPRGQASVATSLRSPTPLSQCQDLPASTEPHLLTIAIRTRALPECLALLHRFAPRPLKKKPPATLHQSCTTVIGRPTCRSGGPAAKSMLRRQGLG